MGNAPKDYVERVYAGWLGKLIGVRHGAPIEGWSYENIRDVYGEITGYLVDYQDFAADDDSNGPIFFIRALEDYTCSAQLTAEQIGLTWLNYVPFEKSFFWWGGYGISTEHTAYLNLRNGILPPRSGSIEQNGAIVAEQIGGQIFADSWGLVVPNNPKLAADFAQKAASVSHDGEGLYGAMFVAACISAAFSAQGIGEVLEAGLSAIPNDSHYSKAVRAVMEFHQSTPVSWEACLMFIREHFWDAQYGGSCHIIPNCAIMALSMVYGEDDFTRTINICNRCGFDTDCNVANVGAILGVLNGLDGIEYDRWRKPINDFFAASSVIGSLNIQDAAQSACYLAGFGYRLAGETPPPQWADILNGKAPRFHFALPGSTHGFRIAASGKRAETCLKHTAEMAHSGQGSLKIAAKALAAGEEVFVYQKTYYCPDDFADSRYDPSFSPVLYPGQKLSAFVRLADCSVAAKACLCVRDRNSGTVLESGAVPLSDESWAELTFKIPALEGACLEKAGVKLIAAESQGLALVAFIDDVDFTGKPEYRLDFAAEHIECWTRQREVVSQCTVLKGYWTLENGLLNGSCADFGELYTGAHDWTDYSVEAELIPQIGQCHRILFRVQGGIRSYALGLEQDGRLVLSKNENGYRVLTEIPYSWSCGNGYVFRIELRQEHIHVFDTRENRLLFAYSDEENPYLRGQIGASVENGSRCQYSFFQVGE